MRVLRGAVYTTKSKGPKTEPYVNDGIIVFVDYNSIVAVVRSY